MAVQLPDIDLLPLLPEILIALGGCTMLLLSAWNGTATRHKIGMSTITLLVITAFMVFQRAVAFKHGMNTDLALQTHLSTFEGMFVGDFFSLYIKMLLLLSTGMTLLISTDYLQRKKMDNGEFFVLILFALLGGMVMASAGDFMTLYLGLELMSLSIYVLAAYRRDNLRSNEAGLKYFILGSLASGLLLYGISLIYGATGTTMFSGIAHHLHESLGQMSGTLAMGMVFVISGLSFKIAAAPFQMWAPDVYEGAPTPITAFMAVMPKVAAFAAIYRVLVYGFGSVHDKWSGILQIVALLSLLIGAFAAIAQTNIKRMLAYSSIGHVGYALIGLAAGGMAGYQSVLIYLGIYIFMSIGTFAIILVLNQEGIGEQIEDYKGLAQKRPLLALLMSIFMFSMAGIPPFAGFIGKLYVFMSAIQAHMYFVAIAGVLFSAVGAFYYLRIVKYMYFDVAAHAFVMPVSGSSKFILTVTTLVILYWGILPSTLTSWAELSIKSLLPSL
ncbi:MAG: NADH-quinone oxidoreductase subunit NuoN [Magnetococcus sp. DMHC-6]